MKKLSLLNLSQHALDKFQQKTLSGGGRPSCICAYICDNCRCSSMADGAVSLNEQGSNDIAGTLVDMIGAKPEN